MQCVTNEKQNDDFHNPHRESFSKLEQLTCTRWTSRHHAEIYSNGVTTTAMRRIVSNLTPFE